MNNGDLEKPVFFTKTVFLWPNQTLFQKWR